MHAPVVEAATLPLDLLPDPYVVLGGDGTLLAANVHFDRRLLAEPRALRMLATVPERSVDVAATVGGVHLIYSAAWTPCVWGDLPARLVRLLDVSHERQNAAYLEAGLHALEDVLDAVPASLLIVDRDGRIISANARWHVSARANGLHMENAGIGTNYLDVCERSAAAGDGDAREVAEGLRAVLARRRLAFEHEYQLLIDQDAGPQWFYLTCTALHGEAGAVIAHFDTTDVHREQEARVDALAHFKATFDGALDGIIIYDDALTIVRANTAMAGLLGCTSAELVGTSLATLMPVEEREAMEAQHAMLRRDGGVRGAVHVRRSDGIVLDLEYSARANVIANQHVAIFRDVTSSRLLEVQLRQSQKMEALGQLTGGIAHDFNNILTVIVANADLALADPAIPEDVRAEVTEVLRSAQRGADMVRKLMAFGRREQLHVQPTDLEQVVQEVSSILKRVLPESIIVHSEARPGLPVVLADATVVQQILLNLATNARDAMGTRGGELRLTVHAEAGPARLGDSGGQGSAAHHVVLSVSDTGCGMNAETLAHLFEPFFTTKRQGEGTGLGMAMVYGLMEQMRGRVTVASREGAGTTVTLRFPAAADGVLAAPPGEVHRVMVARGHEQILLVEDDDAIRALTARILRRAGYTVTTAACGDDAAIVLDQRFRDGVPMFDLIVSDVVMPRGDGTRVLEAARLHDIASRIVWVTGYPGNGSTRGAEGPPSLAPVIQKPWTTSDFLARIRAAIDSPPAPLPDLPGITSGSP